MAITVHTLNKPWLYVEAVAGGSLPADTDFYFIGFNSFINSELPKPYYGYVPGKASDQVSCRTTVINKKIKFEIYENGGYITSFSNAGGGLVTCSSAAHGLTNGTVVYLRNTINYKGKYTIQGVTTDTFNIVAIWVTVKGFSNWYNAPGMPDLPTNCNAILCHYFKWDNYSMLRANGSKIQWLNPNNPLYPNEWYLAANTNNVNTYGHTRWGGGIYYPGVLESQLVIGSDSEKYKYYDVISLNTGEASPWNTSKLYERTSSGGSVTSLHSHPEIAMGKYLNVNPLIRAYQLPNGMPENESAVMINIDNTNSNNTWSDLIKALISSGVVERGCVILPFNCVYYDLQSTLVLRGCIFMEAAVFPSKPVWYSKIITIISGTIYSFTADVTKVLEFNRCFISLDTITSSLWMQPRFSAVNTRVDSFASAFISDNITVKENFTPFSLGAATYYNSIQGINFTRRGDIFYNSVNVIRYVINNQYIRNCNFYRMALNPTLSTGLSLNMQWEMTDVNFYQIQSDAVISSNNDFNFDIMYEYSYLTGLTTNVICNCYNVNSSERSNKLVRVRFCWHGYINPKFNTDSFLIIKFHNSIDIKILDDTSNPIDNASVTITDSTGTTYSLTSNVQGNTPTTQLVIYTVEYDPNNADGYGHTSGTYKFFSKTLLKNPFTITVSKSGYIPVNFTITISSNSYFPISLTPIPQPKLFTRILNLFALKSNQQPITNAQLELNQTQGQTSELGQAQFSSNRKLVTNANLSVDELVEVSPGVWSAANMVDDLQVEVPLDAPVYVDQAIKATISDPEHITAIVRTSQNIKATIT